MSENGQNPPRITLAMIRSQLGVPGGLYQQEREHERRRQRTLNNKAIKYAANLISSNVIRRLALRAGASRVSADAMPVFRRELINFMRPLLRDATGAAYVDGRSTVTLSDVLYAAKRYDVAIYGQPTQDNGSDPADRSWEPETDSETQSEPEREQGQGERGEHGEGSLEEESNL